MHNATLAARGKEPSDHRQAIIEFFDNRAVDYDREYSDQTPGGFASRVRRVRVLDVFDQPGGDVLDVGCGPGLMAPPLIDLGCRFWGVDPSDNMLDIARRRLRGDERANFVKGEAARLDFESNRFDAVICMGVLDWVAEPRAAVFEIVRVLRPGGTLIITFINENSPYASWRNYVFYPVLAGCERLRVKFGGASLKPARVRAGGTRRLLGRRRVLEMIEAAGGRVERLVPHYFNLFVSPLDDLMPSTALRVTEFLDRRGSSLPRWMATGTVVKARKS